MNRNHFPKLHLLSTLLLAGAVGGILQSDSFAKPAAKSDPKSMVQMHEKMAANHKAAADCIQGGKSVKECHQAMMKDGTMGKMGMMKECGMMDHGKMMNDRSKNPSE